MCAEPSQILSTMGRTEPSEQHCRHLPKRLVQSHVLGGKNALWDQLALQQAIVGMLSSTLTLSRSRVAFPVPLVKDTVGGHECVLDQTFAIRGPVCVALPYFWFEKTDREAQWSAAGFDSVHGLPQKEDTLVKVDAKDLDMSGEEGSATGDHDETEMFLPRSV